MGRTSPKSDIESNGSIDFVIVSQKNKIEITRYSPPSTARDIFSFFIPVETLTTCFETHSSPYISKDCVYLISLKCGQIPISSNV